MWVSQLHIIFKSKFLKMYSFIPQKKTVQKHCKENDQHNAFFIRHLTQI